MKEIVLKDFEKWKSRNKDFSSYDYIYQTMKKSQVSTDIYFALYEFINPKFIKINQYIFLKANYTPEKLQLLINKEQKIEFWMNLLYITSFFEDDEDCDEKSECFTRKLVDSWTLKLKHDFPDDTFSVDYLYDSDVGDYGLTFYQIKK